MGHQLVIYTDGAARGNPGKGGFGALLMFGTSRKEIAKAFKHTTNNRMELKAIIEALKCLTKQEIEVSIFTDSSYVVDSINKKWLDGWLKTGFKGKKNKDLWLEYHALSKKFKIKLVWVKGHASNVFNNRCDVLATYAADNGPWEEDEGYINEGMFKE